MPVRLNTAFPYLSQVGLGELRSLNMCGEKMMRRCNRSFATVSLLVATGVAIASCGTEDSLTAVAPDRSTTASSTTSSSASNSSVSLLFENNPAETTLVDTALFLAVLNLPDAEITSDTSATAAAALLGDPDALPTVNPAITPSSTIGLMDFVQPVPGLDLSDGAAILAASQQTQTDADGLIADINALLGTPGETRSLARLPGEDLPVDNADNLEFIDLPTTVSIFDIASGVPIPGEISLTVEPNLAPVTTVLVEVTAADNPNDNLFSNPIPATELSAEFECSLAETNCTVPANDALGGLGGFIPGAGNYNVTVSIIDARNGIIDEEVQAVTLTP
ncbi:MAG: hypothetical protein AAFX40_07690 [Cyanobacteria bacterium J06639_1]